MNQNDSRDWKFRALTEIWTGDAKGNGDRFIPTGLLGSIRWWFEVLVRGLGGKACDPTSSVRCPDHDKKPTEPGHHCVVCELFGCTAWARKFRLMVLDEQGKVIQTQINVIQTQKKAGMNFTLRFIPLRPICDEEWCLLDMTLRLIADYGAIGGKTVLKPSDEKAREGVRHHKDYGLLRCQSGPEGWKCNKTRQDLENYVRSERWRQAPHTYKDEGRMHDFRWASLEYFWCVRGKYLARQNANASTFNLVIGRKQPKNQGQALEHENDTNRWLAGGKQESKKVFSFKHPQEARRTFGFVHPGPTGWNEIQTLLKRAWGNKFSLLTRNHILQTICNG